MACVVLCAAWCGGGGGGGVGGSGCGGGGGGGGDGGRGGVRVCARVGWPTRGVLQTAICASCLSVADTTRRPGARHASPRRRSCAHRASGGMAPAPHVAGTCRGVCMGRCQPSVVCAPTMRRQALHTGDGDLHCGVALEGASDRCHRACTVGEWGRVRRTSRSWPMGSSSSAASGACHCVHGAIPRRGPAASRRPCQRGAPPGRVPTTPAAHPHNGARAHHC